MDLLSFRRSHRSISNRHSLNKVAIIIPILKSAPSSSRLTTRPAELAHLHETFPSASGSTDTVGQAFAQLSFGTSDYATPKHYDLSRSFGGPTSPSDRSAYPPLAGNQVSVATEVLTYEVEVRRFPRAIYSFGRKGRARPRLCLWCAILSSQPSQLRSREKQPFTSKIDPYCQRIFSRDQTRGSHLRLIEAKNLSNSQIKVKKDKQS